MTLKALFKAFIYKVYDIFTKVASVRVNIGPSIFHEFPQHGLRKLLVLIKILLTSVNAYSVSKRFLG